MDDFRLNGVVKAIEKIYGIRFEPEEDDDYTFSQLGELNLDFRPSEAEPKQPPSSYLCVRYGKNIVLELHEDENKKRIYLFLGQSGIRDDKWFGYTDANDSRSKKLLIFDYNRKPLREEHVPFSEAMNHLFPLLDGEAGMLVGREEALKYNKKAA